MTKRPSKRPLLSAELRCRLEELLSEKELPAGVRREVLKALGRSPRVVRRNVALIEATKLMWLLQTYKEVMRVCGYRPRGGVHPTALEWVAGDTGTTVANVKQKLRRHVPKGDMGVAFKRVYAKLARVIAEEEAAPYSNMNNSKARAEAIRATIVEIRRLRSVPHLI